jgi:aminomethyltransferase
VRIGLTMPAGSRSPRQGYPILSGGKRIGEVTSGAPSPTLGHPIAMGYVPPEFSKPGLELQIDIRGRVEQAEVVALPFYQREKKGTKK